MSMSLPGQIKKKIKKRKKKKQRKNIFVFVFVFIFCLINCLLFCFVLIVKSGGTSLNSHLESKHQHSISNGPT